MLEILQALKTDCVPLNLELFFSLLSGCGSCCNIPDPSQVYRTHWWIPVVRLHGAVSLNRALVLTACLALEVGGWNFSMVLKTTDKQTALNHSQ